MKSGMKGLGGIKGLLLLHGEKIAIAVVGLLALWFVYGSLSLPRLESRYQAPRLEEEINQTTARVRDAEWPSPDSDLADNVRYSRELAKSAEPRVNPEFYGNEGAGFTAVIPPTQRRVDPELLNAVDVMAIGGSGLFAFVDEDIRRKQELARAAAEAERAREAAKQAERQQELAEQGRQGRRGREEGPGFGGEFDPQHPNRRMVQGTSRPAGIPLQGGERIERAYWATVVAKVPISKQLEAYQDAFKEARGYDPANDFPQYKGYMVQRAEVVRGKPLEWKGVGVFDPQRRSIASGKPIAPVVSESALIELAEKASTDWAGQPMEPVDPRYLDPLLTMPLPPLVGRDFGADATHPEIPLAINAPPPEEELALEEEKPADQPADPEDPLAHFRSDPTRSGQLPGRPGLGMRPGMGMGGRGRFGGMPGGMGEMGPMRMPGGFRGEGGPRGFPGGEMGMGRGGYAGMSGQQGVLPRGVDHYLLRFYDFTVEPGKKYKYRVRLVVADPNYGMPDKALESDVQDRLRANKKKDYRIVEEWSEPSPTVGIPVAGMLRLAEADPPSGRSFNDEPTVKLMVEMFDVGADGTAIHIAKEEDFRRGYVVNLRDEMEYTGDGDRWIDKFDDYKLYTGVTLLDVDGGNYLTKDFNAPARMLLMGPSGELSIRKELDDQTAVAYLRMLFAEPEEGRGGEGFMPFGRGGMEFGGER